MVLYMLTLILLHFVSNKNPLEIINSHHNYSIFGASSKHVTIVRKADMQHLSSVTSEHLA